MISMDKIREKDLRNAIDRFVRGGVWPGLVDKVPHLSIPEGLPAPPPDSKTDWMQSKLKDIQGYYRKGDTPGFGEEGPPISEDECLKLQNEVYQKVIEFKQKHPAFGRELDYILHGYPMSEAWEACNIERGGKPHIWPPLTMNNAADFKEPAPELPKLLAAVCSHPDMPLFLRDAIITAIEEQEAPGRDDEDYFRFKLGRLVPEDEGGMNDER